MTPDRRRRFRIVAVVVALTFIAAGAISVYRDHHKHYVDSTGLMPVPVLVATRPIPKGARARAISLDLTPVQMAPARAVHDAITNWSEIAREVTLVQIPRGAQLTTADFGPANG